MRAAVVAIDGGRPAIMSREALADLDELLKFRHLARHGYETRPDEALMVQHGRRVERASAALDASLRALDVWLRS